MSVCFQAFLYGVKGLYRKLYRFKADASLLNRTFGASCQLEISCSLDLVSMDIFYGSNIRYIRSIEFAKEDIED